MSKDYKKGIRIVDKYIKKAQNYKAKNGYKENLGYEYYSKIMEELSDLELTYAEECDIKNYFNRKCDNL